jgi:hypothetical protein
VPGRKVCSAALPSPTTFAVIRSPRPSGAAESEYGCDRVQPVPPRKRKLKNWPASAGTRSSIRPAMCTDRTPFPSGTTAVTRSP